MKKNLLMATMLLTFVAVNAQISKAVQRTEAGHIHVYVYGSGGSEITRIDLGTSGTNNQLGAFSSEIVVVQKTEAGWVFAYVHDKTGKSVGRVTLGKTSDSEIGRIISANGSNFKVAKKVAGKNYTFTYDKSGREISRD